MNLGVRESGRLAQRLVDSIGHGSLANDVVVAPSFPALGTVADVVRGTMIELGAQDMFWEERGAFTSGVSPLILRELEVHYVLVGHSERRQHVGETDIMIHHKVAAALEHQITPIICVGETMEERRDGRRDLVLAHQVQAALTGIAVASPASVIVAYEPVWVIGTGRPVEGADARHATEVIRQALRDLWHSDALVQAASRVVYGGSVDRDNIRSFLSQDVIDGALVGGASLHPEEFVEMIQSNYGD